MKSNIFIATLCLHCTVAACSSNDDVTVLSGNPSVDDVQLFDVSQFPNRINQLPDFTCGESTDDILNSISEALSDSPNDTYNVGIDFQVCGSNYDFERSETVITDGTNQLRTGIIIKSTAPQPIPFWIFVFNNNEDITSEVLGDRNLVTFGGEKVLRLPIPIDFANKEATNITFLAVDANLAYTDNARSNGMFYSSRIASPDSPFPRYQAVNYIDSSPGTIDPDPYIISFSERESDFIELVFASGGDFSELGFIVTNFKTGRTVNIDCGQGINGINSVFVAGTPSTVINCILPPDIDPLRDVLFSVSMDYFYDDSVWSGAFGGQFERLVATH